MQSVESTHTTAKAGAGALVSALVLAVVAIGCGSSSQNPSSVSGVVASDTSTASAVTVKDSSTPALERTAAVDASGTYEVDVTGLRAPYLVEAKDDAGTAQYALATTTGSTNVNGLSDATVRAGSDDEDKPDRSYRVHDIEGLTAKLRTVLAPLFQHYGISFGDGMEDSAAYRTMLSEVSFTISDRTLFVKNRATGEVIYSAPLRDLTSGTLNAAAIPAGTPAPAPTPTPTPDPTPTPTPTPDPTPTPTPTPSTCTYTYNAWSACSSSGTQTRTVATASPAGCTGTPVLTQTCTYTPPSCSYTYSTWGACDSTGTQSRTVLSTAPSGCTGTPVLSQSCAPPAPTNPVTFQNVVSSCTGCHGLTSNTTVFKSGGYTVSGRSASQWLSTVNNMVNRGASLAPGTTAQNYADYLANVP